MPSRMFTKTQLLSTLWQEEGGFEIVKDEIDYTSRWSEHHSLIFKAEDGRYWQTDYSKGLTEQQDEQPFQDEGDEIECLEYEPYTREVTLFRLKGDAKVLPPVTLEQAVTGLARVIAVNKLCEKHGEDVIGVLMKCGAFRDGEVVALSNAIKEQVEKHKLKLRTEPGPYPEHSKLKKIADKSQVCGEFVDWLREEKALDWEDVQDRPLAPLQGLLAEFFEIDEDKIEEEKRAMLDECRRLHEGRKDDDKQSSEAG